MIFVLENLASVLHLYARGQSPVHPIKLKKNIEMLNIKFIIENGIC